MESVTHRYVHKIEGKGYLDGVTLLDTTSKKQKCHQFGSVPYALPLRSNLRWKRAKTLPVDYTYGSHDNPTKCSELSAICPQTGGHGLDPLRMSEDCLQCNIWLPIGRPPEHGWPVLIYIRTLALYMSLHYS